MIRGRFALLLAVSISAPALVGGCGSDSFLPPPPEGLRPTTTQPVSSAPVQSREIALVLPGESNLEIDTWEGYTRKEAGELRVGFRLIRPEASDPPAKQGELIKQAARNSSGFIVVTNGSPETTAALAALSAENKPIVLLGRALPNSPEAAKVKATHVTYESFDNSAKKMVDAAVLEAKKSTAAKTKDPLECIITRSKFKDESSDIRAAALEKAAKAAGLKLVASVEFAGDSVDLNKQLEGPLKAHPNLAVLLSDEETPLSGITYGRGEAPDPAKVVDALGKQEPPVQPPLKFKIAGYSTSKHSLNLARSGQISATTDRNIAGLARRAILAVRDTLDGKTAGPKIEVPMLVVISPNATAKP